MENGINTVSVYGDSILKGAVTGTGSGHLFDITKNDSLSLAAAKLGFKLNNQSVFGNIITKSYKRFLRDAERNALGDLAIIESGGNDCDYDWAQVCSGENLNPRVGIDEFISTIDKMAKTCRQNGTTPLIMTMPPLVPDRWLLHICRGYDEQKVKVFVNSDIMTLYQNHETYNAHLVKYSFQNNVQIVDMRLAFLESKKDKELMCQDGIHPNEAGYRFMAEIWEKELPKIKNEFPK